MYILNIFYSSVQLRDSLGMEIYNFAKNIYIHICIYISTRSSELHEYLNTKLFSDPLVQDRASEPTDTSGTAVAV